MDDKRQCTHCQTWLKIPAAAADKAVRCSTCKTIIPPVVPAVEVPAVQVVEPPAAPRRPAVKRTAKVAADEPDDASNGIGDRVDAGILARAKNLSLRLEDFSSGMQEKIRDQLFASERIVWVGRPHRGPRFVLLMLLALPCLAVSGLLFGGSLYYDKPMGVAVGFAICPWIGYFMATVQWFYQLLFSRSICYVLTSRRVLVCYQHHDLIFGTQVFTFEEGPAAYPEKSWNWLLPNAVWLPEHIASKLAMIEKWLFPNVGTLHMGRGIYLPIQKFLGGVKVSKRVNGLSYIGNLDEVEALVHATLQPHTKAKAKWAKAVPLHAIIGCVGSLVLLFVVCGGFLTAFTVFDGWKMFSKDAGYHPKETAEKREADDKLRSVPWKVQADPGADVPAAADAAIPAGSATVIYSGSPAAFVAVNPAGNPNEFQVYDLSTGRPVGERHMLKMKAGSRPALSPDGQRLAFQVEGRTDLVDARGVLTRKNLSTECKKEKANGFEVKDVRFANKDRLLIILQKGAGPDVETVVTAVDVAKKSIEFRLKGSFLYQAERAAVSPGGNYLVVQGERDRNFLIFYDLRNGQMAGTRAIKEADVPDGEAAGLCFSPDGKSLLLLWKTKEKGWGRLIQWNLVLGGMRVGNQVIEQPPPGSDKIGRYPLQWLADGRGCLVFGHLILDPTWGKVLGKVEPEPAGADDERVLVGRDRVGRFTAQPRPQVQIRSLPKQ